MLPHRTGSQEWTESEGGAHEALDTRRRDWFQRWPNPPFVSDLALRARRHYGKTLSSLESLPIPFQCRGTGPQTPFARPAQNPRDRRSSTPGPQVVRIYLVNVMQRGKPLYKRLSVCTTCPRGIVSERTRSEGRGGTTRVRG